MFPRDLFDYMYFNVWYMYIHVYSKPYVSKMAEMSFIIIFSAAITMHNKGSHLKKDAL